LRVAAGRRGFRPWRIAVVGFYGGRGRRRSSSDAGVLVFGDGDLNITVSDINLHDPMLIHNVVECKRLGA
jgi:hypothetical protein